MKICSTWKRKTHVMSLDLQEKEAQKGKSLKHTGHLFRMNLQLKDIC